MTKIRWYNINTDFYYVFYECKPFVYIYGKKKVSAEYKCDISTSTCGKQLVK